jgi:branched-chain amino acid transport system substrate-binding protein
MRRLCALIVVTGLFAAAAGTAAASNRRAGTPAPGVTSNQIQLGITYVDLSKLGSTVNIDFGDWQKIYKTVIDDLDAKGGINGRKVVPVFAPVEPLGTVPAQEACTKLTEDNHVFAVTGFFLNDAPLCYLEQHRTPVINGTITSEFLARAKAPWFSLEPGDALNAKAIDAFAADHAFKGGKLGIVVDAPEQGLYDSVVHPALQRHKITGTVATITATTGDEVATEAQAGPIAQRFQSEGINQVLMVGTSALQFANVLAKTTYRPRLVVLSYAVLQAFAANPGSALDVAQKAITAYTNINFNDPALQKCFRLITAATGYNIKNAQPTAGQPDYRDSSLIACDSVALFAAIAGAAGKNLTVQSFGKAGQQIGSVQIPGAGKVPYDAKAHSFLQPLYIYRYDPATKTLVPDKTPAA